MSDPEEMPLWSWRGYLADVIFWDGPCEVITSEGYHQEVYEGNTVAEVQLVDIYRSWAVPVDELIHHAEPVNLAAFDQQKRAVDIVGGGG